MSVENRLLKESFGGPALGRIACGIKGAQGDFDERAFQRAALRVLGYDPKARLEISGFKISPARVKLGENLRIAVQLVSRASGPQPLVLDYALHFTRHSSLRNGGRGSKVFKLKTCTLAPGEKLAVEKIHKFRRITTRRHYAGRHAVEIIVNGVSRAQAEFDLML